MDVFQSFDQVPSKLPHHVFWQTSIMTNYRLQGTTWSIDGQRKKETRDQRARMRNRYQTDNSDWNLLHCFKKNNNPLWVNKIWKFTICTWKWISVIYQENQNRTLIICEILSVWSCYKMVHDCLSKVPEIITDLYRAPLPTKGGYLSHTTHRSVLCSDDPDHGWDVPNSGQKQGVSKWVK